MKIHRMEKTIIVPIFFAAGVFFSACSKEQSKHSEELVNTAQADVSVNDPSSSCTFEARNMPEICRDFEGCILLGRTAPSFLLVDVDGGDQAFDGVVRAKRRAITMKTGTGNMIFS